MKTSVRIVVQKVLVLFWSYGDYLNMLQQSGTVTRLTQMLIIALGF